MNDEGKRSDKACFVTRPVWGERPLVTFSRPQYNSPIHFQLNWPNPLSATDKGVVSGDRHLNGP